MVFIREGFSQHFLLDILRLRRRAYANVEIKKKKKNLLVIPHFKILFIMKCLAEGKNVKKLRFRNSPQLLPSLFYRI
jgi:hypothetical protein